MNEYTEAIKVLLKMIEQKELLVSEDGVLFKWNKRGELWEVHKECKNKYKVIGVHVPSLNKRVSIYQHRLLYAYYHGLDSLDPELTINHINYDRYDNSKDNLEQITKSENSIHGQFNRPAVLDPQYDGKFNCNLGELIESNGRYKKWVAMKMDVNLNMLNNYIKGRVEIPEEKAKIIADEIGFGVEELYN